MTKTSIIAIALFSSACATDASDYEDARANAEDELEEIIRNLNGDDDDESSSDKMGPNDVSESPTETVDTTVLEKAMNEFKDEMESCNPLRGVAGKYSPAKQKFMGYVLDEADMPTGEMHGVFSIIQADSGIVKGSLKDYSLFDSKVGIEGDIVDGEILADLDDGAMTLFVSLADSNNEPSAPALGMIAICD